jgi:hypothetical protein
MMMAGQGQDGGMSTSVRYGVQIATGTVGSPPSSWTTIQERRDRGYASRVLAQYLDGGVRPEHLRLVRITRTETVTVL